MLSRPLTKERLLKARKIDSKTGCWLWMRGCASNGYGNLNSFGKQYKPHRVAMHLWRGMCLDDARLVCHKCDKPSCFNPKHLFLGNNSDNVQDSICKDRWCTGDRQWQARLTWNKVAKIRKYFATGTITKAALARKYCVGETTIRNVVNNWTWKTSKGAST